MRIKNIKLSNYLQWRKTGVIARFFSYHCQGMESTNKLDAIIDDWSKVEKESYQLALRLAQERFNERVLESESITTKSIKMLLLNVSLFGWFVSIAIKKELSMEELPTLSVFVTLIVLIGLVMPKQVRDKGISPAILFPDYFDKKHHGDEQVKLIYFNAVSIVQQNIDVMSILNSQRAKKYQLALILSMINIVLLAYSVVILL